MHGFTFDVFLSHSAKDKPAVRAVAERLRGDGLRVWFDEWEIKAGDSIPAKIEDGLEHSRVLVLCMSANAFGADWPQLEAGTFRFRDPLNKERRFIPLRLDDAPIKGSLAQFLYIDWRTPEREWEYNRLCESCGFPGVWRPLSTLGIQTVHDSCHKTRELTIDSAVDRFQFLGVSAQFVVATPSFREKLTAKVKPRCTFQFLLLNPDSQNPGTCDHAQREKRRVSELCQHILAGTSLLTDLREEHGVDVEWRYYDDLPDFRLVILNDSISYVGYYGCEHHEGINLPQLVVVRTPTGLFTPFRTLWETRWKSGKH